MMARQDYVVISPVKDEERFVERTLVSMANQTVRPKLWLIVNDGSRDQTPAILERYASNHSWIRVVNLASDSARSPGPGVIRAFNAGLALLEGLEFDFIVKLDCDLDIPAGYFEKLLARFQGNAKLGIASGVYLEKRPGGWVPIEMPAYHVAGAMKMMRHECFRQIAGFVSSRGWDTVDEIRAQVRGWETKHYTDLRVLHLKDEGSGIGFLRTGVMSGEIYYLTGGGVFFFILKAFQRLVFGRPLVLGSVAMVAGYLQCLLSGRARLVSKDEARHYRAQLNKRIWDSVYGRFAPKAS